MSSMRLTMKEREIITHVKEGSEDMHRKCNSQVKINKNWLKYYFGLAAKNSIQDDRKFQVISDVDINSIKITSLDPAENFPDKEEVSW